MLFFSVKSCYAFSAVSGAAAAFWHSDVILYYLTLSWPLWRDSGGRFSGEDPQLGILAASWPRWRPGGRLRWPGKAAAADLDPDQGEDPQLDPRCLVASCGAQEGSCCGSGSWPG